MFLRPNLATYLLLLFSAAGSLNAAFAEEESSSAASEILSAEATVETSIAASEDVQPLDNWAEPSSEGAKSEIFSSTGEQFNNSAGSQETELSPSTSDLEIPVLGNQSAILKKAQIRRLKKAENNLRKVVYREQQERVAESSKDPRGQSEIRICSANFNGFGTKEENERLLKKIPKPRLKKAEKSILNAIVSANCDVVAVQGIIGRSPTFATDALVGFAKKLSKKTGKLPWKAEVARSKEQSGYQGFLVKDSKNSPIVKSQFETIPDSIMKIPGRYLKTTVKSRSELVPRDFFKLRLEVKSSDQLPKDLLSLEAKNPLKPIREVVIINGILANSVAPFQPTNRLLKLQIADIATRLFVAEQTRITPDEQPIVLSTIERVEGILGAAQQILTGRLSIEDFKNEGVCKIISEIEPEGEGEKEKIEKEKGESESDDGAVSEAKVEKKPNSNKKVDFTIDTNFDCKSPLERPQPRFDLLATVPFDKKIEPPKDAAEEPTKKRAKPSKRDLELQTAGIFLISADLKYSAKKGANLLNSAASRIEISNGLPGAYLVWVDLNW